MLISSLLLVFFSDCFSQTLSELTGNVSMDTIMKTVSELSGEEPAMVNNIEVVIDHRVSDWGNDLAADYIKEKLESYGLDVSDISFSSTGRNIYAVQRGSVNPGDIYILCAHYDAVTYFCADDNASGTAAVLEAARILSPYCFENTIIYALWDEEEVGFRGARHYAEQAAAQGDNILGVVNVDMCGYDGDDDGVFDIDVRNIANSYEIRDDLLDVVGELELALTAHIVDPGTFGSDHSVFWNEGYSALLLGEAWSTGDRCPAYHTSDDRIELMNPGYFTKMVKLGTGYLAKNAVITPYYAYVGNDGISLYTDNISNATYQWVNCDNNFSIIEGASLSEFYPEWPGNYAVQVSTENCKGTSNCQMISVTGEQEHTGSWSILHPNPVDDLLSLNTAEHMNDELQILSIDGQVIMQFRISSINTLIDVKHLPPALYLLTIEAKNGDSYIFNFIKS